MAGTKIFSPGKKFPNGHWCRGKVIDFHCHILPDLDDGAPDWEHSVEMARIAVADGISGIVCTPHLSPVFPDNDRKAVMASVEQLRIRLRKAEIPLELYPGAELAIDSDLGEKIKSNEVMTINDNRNVALIEMPVETIPPNIERFFWSIQSTGIDIVLGHPERNPCLMKDPSILFRWIQRGVMVQVTASALAGKHGHQVRDFTVNLLKRRMIHLVASDSHGPTRRRPGLSAARAVVESVIGKEEAHKIFCENPQQLLLGTVPDFAPPLQALKKTSFLQRILTLRS
ncbi:MAG: hypothetical protein M0Z81_14000 [Deltaproteobacteria bacterium]|nr:hypothetical protein [Deltaproteobacteria bacterium]